MRLDSLLISIGKLVPKLIFKLLIENWQFNKFILSRNWTIIANDQ